MEEIPVHPMAAIFPMMEGAPFDELVEDIRQHGVREPVILYQWQILDGRNRYRAAQAAGAECQFVAYGTPAECNVERVARDQFLGGDEYIAWRDLPEDGGESFCCEYGGELSDPLSLVISKNLRRRHLNESQRAMVAAKIANMPLGGASYRSANLPTDSVSQAAASDMLNVGDRTVRDAKFVQQNAVPELIAAVEQGRVSVSKAAAIAEESEDFQRKFVESLDAGKKPTEALREARRDQLPEKIAALPDGKYRVIYCDPPWQYNDARQTGDHRESTGALHHYSTMTLDELKALDVRGLAADDAVMLMWATCPLIPEALELLRAWGFKYKTKFIWDKGHGAFGSYHDAEAEELLIGTIGSCVPEADHKEKQIQRFPRSGHSAKPEDWRALIDRLWRAGPRIELFRRGPVPQGWLTWGAEAEDAA